MIAGMPWYTVVFAVVAVAGVALGWRVRRDSQSFEPGAGAAKLGRM